MTEQIVHKKGGDDLIEVLPNGNQIVNWGGFNVVFGVGKDPFFFDEIAQRRQENRSNMIVITGSPGEGKSYFALRLAEIFDPKFDVTEQIVFDRLHLLMLIGNNSPLKRGQVIIIDEAQFVAGSRRWYEEIQKDIMEHLEAVRSKGFIIIIVALHLDLLDKIVRKYVLSFMIFIEQRGHGIVYRLYTPRFETNMFRNRLGKVNLKLPDYNRCSHPDCLDCKFRGTCMTNRAVYERQKREFLGKKSAESIEEIKRKEVSKITNDDISRDLIEKCQAKFVFTNRGTIEKECIRSLAEKELGIVVPYQRCGAIQKIIAGIIGVQLPKKE